MYPLRRDLLLVWTLRCCTAVAAALVLLVLIFLGQESVAALRHVGVARFFTDPSWDPKSRAADGAFNLVPMLLGTVLVTSGAVLTATPLGILSAVFCRFYAPRPIASAYRRMIELLAGIPSVVYGLWGLVVLVPLIRRIEPPGPSLLAGVIVLTIMIMPTVALTADAAFSQVARAHLRGAAALGLSRRATVRGVVFPAARSGLYTGVILETGRAIGETMAVLMVCGNIVRTPDSLFAPVRTLTANIALEMSYAMGDHRSALFVTGLVLMALVVGLVLAADRITRGHVHG
ncbi:MAG: phosphate ABC transporter permease subunit PstC [Phycisphaerae bacterium]